MASRSQTLPVSHVRGWLSVAVSAALGCLLAWLVVSTSLFKFLVELGPQAVAQLSPGHASANLRLADEKLQQIKSRHPETVYWELWTGRGASGPATPTAGAPSPFAKDLPEIEEAHRHAQAALAGRPMSSKALLLAGEASQLKGDRAVAVPLVERAVELSRRETWAAILLIQRGLAANDLAGSVDHIDAVIRTRPQLTEMVMPALTRIAELPGGIDVVKQRLAINPPWLRSFLSRMLVSITNARTPLEIQLHLKANGISVHTQEINEYHNFLIGHKLFELAHQAWLLMLPEDRLEAAGFVYNGEFKFRPSGSPFDWSLREGTGGATLEVAAPSDDPSNPALKFTSGSGRVQFGEVSQRVMLPPGSYHLTGRTRGGLKGRRGLRWRVFCAAASNNQMLAESEILLGQAEWQEFKVPLQVPELGCTTQMLRLVHDVRHASEQFLTGDLWLDGIAIVRSNAVAAAGR